MNLSGIRTTKIEKLDEVNGVTEFEVLVEIGDAVEVSGAGPSISRSYIRGVEDQVEQNDNSFDGVINNTPAVTHAGVQEAVEQEKKSVHEKLKETDPVIPPIPERKPAVIYPELELH